MFATIVAGGISVVILMSILAQEKRFVNEMSDEELLEKIKQYPEVRTFLEKYPTAKYYIDRQRSVAIDFEIKRSDISNETWDYAGIPEPSAVLNTQISPDLNLEELYLDCFFDNRGDSSGNVFTVNDKIVEYLEQDGDCWNDNSRKSNVNK